MQAEFDDINPAFADWQYYDGKRYGLVVDGDVLVTYYRKDLLEDPENQAAFKAKYGYDLAPPADYTQFGDIACFLTEKYAARPLRRRRHQHRLHVLLLLRALPRRRRTALRPRDDEAPPSTPTSASRC